MADYDVGYKKPPRHSQFKPGNRANPQGRRGKRESRKESEIVHDVMNGSVEFHEGDKLKRARRIQIMIKGYGAAALKGEVRAAETLLKIRAEFAGNRAMEPSIMYLTEEDMMAARGSHNEGQ